jgi:hypothetical protein
VGQLLKLKIVRITKLRNEKPANLENQNVAEKIHGLIHAVVNVMIAAIAVAHNNEALINGNKNEKKLTSIPSQVEILWLKRSAPGFLLVN